jgi:hypothetical protein
MIFTELGSAQFFMHAIAAVWGRGSFKSKMLRSSEGWWAL